MTAGVSNIVVCPSCGAENIRGLDACESCLMDLRASDSESALLAPVISARLSRPATIDSTASVRDAIALLIADPNGAVVVMEGTVAAGIFTERDVLKRIAGRPERLDAPITTYMTPDPVLLHESDTMAVALNKMGGGGFRHIPVVRDGRLVALVTARDVLQWIMARYFD
jgi:CBS domain-containing protein